MKNTIKTAGILLFKNDKILLVKHGKKAGHLEDTYGLPAGRIKDGETVREAAARELLEETGLRTRAEELIPLPQIYTAAIQRKEGIKHFSQENFLCHNWEGQLKWSDETAPEWIKIEDLDRFNLLPNVKEMVMEGWKVNRRKPNA